MTLVILEIEERRFPLSFGAYLIRGIEAKIIDAEFNIQIENESIENKHALITAEADGIAIFDLDTRIGTFIGGQRLPALTKHIIATEEEVSIRFGNVDGKFIKCSTLEQHHSSGFHEESMHLILEKSNETGNLTIPETQFICPENVIGKIPGNDESNCKNISADISIPETQDLFDVISASTANPKQIEDEVERASSPIEENGNASQFCISSQEFNDCFDDAEISNSRDLLDEINWDADDGEAAIALKAIEKNDELIEHTKAAEIECKKNADSVAAEHAKESNAMEQEDLHRSQTHTPDLFYEELLEKFESKEARMNNAKANRAQNEETKSTTTDDEYSGKCTQTASEKSLNNNSFASTPKTTVANVDDTAKTSPRDLLPSSSTPKAIDYGEQDLFEGEPLEIQIKDVEHDGTPPYQQTNKENMLVGAAMMADLAPTQVYVSKKSIKPPAEPLKIPLNTAQCSSMGLASDLEPTQLFKPKKKNFRKAQAANNNAIPDDLEPTQKYVPKKITRSATKTNPTAIENANNNSNSITSIESMENATSKQTIQVQSPKVMDDGKNYIFEPVSPDKSAPIMLTPEIIGNAFAEENFLNVSALRKLCNRDDDSDNDDSLTRLLMNRRIDNDFEILMKSIKRNKSNCSITESTENEYELFQKYMTKGECKKSPEKNKAEKESSEQVEKHSLRKKLTLAEQPTIEDKHRKTNEVSETVVNSKIKKIESLAADNEQPSTSGASIGRPQRSATVGIKGDAIVNTKIKETESLTSNVGQPSTSGRATRQKRPAPVDPDVAVVNPKVSRIESLSFNDQQRSSSRTTTNRPKRVPSKQHPKSNSSDERNTWNSSSESVNKNDDDGAEMEKNVSAKSSAKKNSGKRKLNSNESAGSVKEIKVVEVKREEPPKRSSRQRKVTPKATTTTTTTTTTTSDSISKKPSKLQLERAAKEEPNIWNHIELTPPIVTSQALRTRSRTASTASLSQETKPTISSEESIELPTTSRAAARAMLSNKSKTDGKSVLKLSFTMVHPDKKLELLKHANNKWVEVQDPADSEILVMDNGNRTFKFLIAVAKGIPIVTSKWVDAIKATGVVSTRSNYFLKDAAFEKNFKFSLLHTLTEAKKAKVFTNFQFLMTSSLTPTSNEMKVIITCAGGTVLENDSIPTSSGDQQFYLISSEKDRQHWHSYRRKIANLCITSTEAVMIAIMRYDANLLKTQSY